MVNRKFIRLSTVHIDSVFYRNIKSFRKQLSSPAPDGDARTGFDAYQKLGNYIYMTVFEPVRKYLISDRILIAPDDILSYIPFKALPVSIIPSGGIFYKNLPYLMNEFRISYTYSATLMAESIKHDYSVSNKVIAFAPVYPAPINLDSLFLTRQGNSHGLSDLPFALYPRQNM